MSIQPVGLIEFRDDHGHLHFIEASIIDTIEELADDLDPDRRPAKVARIHRRNGSFTDSCEPALDLAHRYAAVLQGYAGIDEIDDLPDDDGCADKPA